MPRRSESVSWWILAALLTLSQPCNAGDPPNKSLQKPARAPATLTLKATILLPDGTPAAKAVLHSHDNADISATTARADESGKVKLQDQFPSGLRLHAVSADGRNQAVVLLPNPAAVRSRVSQPLTITLKPAKPHQVVVTADGQSIEGALVAINGQAFRQTDVTGADGTVVVWLAAESDIGSVVAWHPKHGVNGIRNLDSTKPGDQTELALLPPAPHVVRIVDNEGQPVRGLTVTASVRTTDSDWILARAIDAARATSNDDGEVHFGWFPAQGLKYVDLELLNDGWKEDKTDREKTPNGVTTVHVRKEFPVEGRLVLPEEARARGILVTGFGFGPGNTGDIPRARTRKDGTFTMHVPAAHGYVLGVSDLQWSSELWSGAIIPFEGAPPREIVLKGNPATPLNVLVTRGSPPKPVTKAFVHVDRNGEVNWTDETGESRTGHAGIGGWLLTDENGRASTGVGHSEIEVRLSSDDWNEEKTIEVTSDESVTVEFHREWIGNRVLTARPVVEEEKYVPSSDAVALAWTERSPYVDTIHDPIVTESGTVKVEFDEYKVSILLIDRKQHLAGFAQAGPKDETIELSMQPTATYSGTLVDRHDKSPLADRTVRLITDSSFQNVVEPRQTDQEGRFEFHNVPAGVPLRLSVKDEPGRPDYTLFGSDRLFQPGEQRTGKIAKASLMDGNTAVVYDRPDRTIAERIASTVKNTRAMGMRTLIVLEGAESKSVTHVAGRLCNYDEIEAVRRYLTVQVTAEQRSEAADALSGRNWPKPEDGEVVLVVTNDGQEAAATLNIDCSNMESAVERGTKFIETHAPKMTDGRKKLQAAKEKARDTNRALWVISGGCRCGPCFRLAHWIDEHHDVLEKDLVIVKVTGGLDKYAHEIGKEIGGEGHGIPFHALMAPDGEILWTSEGPLGNIGMPGTPEGIRHFQEMLEAARQRMTSAEVDDLIDSLKKE